MPKHKKVKVHDGNCTPASAQRVLFDARFAIGELRKAISSGELQRTRVSWLTAVTLLRSIGHVLKAKDSTRSSWLEEAIERQFAKLKTDRFSNLIYWEFIVEERNMLLKEYSSSIFDVIIDEDVVIQRPRIEITNLLVGGQFFSPVDAADAAQLWWSRQLSQISDDAQAVRFAQRNIKNDSLQLPRNR